MDSRIRKNWCEYSEIVLGEGNTYKTTRYPNGETLLTITFTEIPAIDGYNTFNKEESRNGVLEYPLAITNSNGFDSKDGVRLANNRVEFGDRTDLYNDAAPVATDSKCRQMLTNYLLLNLMKQLILHLVMIRRII